MAIEIADSDVDVADDVATDRHRQASLVDDDLFVIEWFDHGVDGDGQRDRRLVGVSGILANLHHDHPTVDADLGGGESSAVRVAHRVDQIIDQVLSGIVSDR